MLKLRKRIFKLPLKMENSMLRFCPSFTVYLKDYIHRMCYQMVNADTTYNAHRFCHNCIAIITICCLSCLITNVSFVNFKNPVKLIFMGAIRFIHDLVVLI